MLAINVEFFTGIIARSAKHRYLSYSEGNFATFVAPMYNIMAALRIADADIIFLLCGFFFFFLLLIPRLISALADWMSTILLHMVWP